MRGRWELLTEPFLNKNFMNYLYFEKEKLFTGNKIEIRFKIILF